jgi:GntR family transcriptional regulator
MSQFLNPFPKYMQIRQLLLRRLQQELRPGDPFPSDKALMSEFGVSRETVREALNGLAEDKWIARHRGQGTFVLEAPSPKQADRRISGLAEDLSDLHADTESKVLEKGVVRVPPDIAAPLHLGADESTYKFVRVRFFEGEPLSYVETYLPIDIGQLLARLDLERTSIMAQLRQTLKVPFTEKSQTIEAVVADAMVARLLEVPVGAPLLLISRLLMVGVPERPMLFRSHFRADRYFYTVQLAQPRAARSSVAKPAPKRRRAA